MGAHTDGELFMSNRQLMFLGFTDPYCCGYFMGLIAKMGVNTEKEHLLRFLSPLSGKFSSLVVEMIT